MMEKKIDGCGKDIKGKLIWYENKKQNKAKPVF